MDTTTQQLLTSKGLDLLVDTVSGALVTAIVFAAWRAKEAADRGHRRRCLLAERSARVSLLQAELETIASFTERCEIAGAALEQFAVYQQWLVANGLMSWKQNRLMVQTWQQTTGVAVQIRLGNVPVNQEVIGHLVTDIRRTDLPTPEDDDFRWEQAGSASPIETAKSQ